MFTSRHSIDGASKFGQPHAHERSSTGRLMDALANEVALKVIIIHACTLLSSCSSLEFAHQDIDSGHQDSDTVVISFCAVSHRGITKNTKRKSQSIR